MPACLSCGASLAPSDDRCPLCGTLAGATDPDAPETPDADASVSAAALADAPALGACPSCGHANPAGARFCNACGHALAASGAEPSVPPGTVPVGALPDAAPAPERPSSAAGRQALVVMGVGVGAVAMLYGVSVWSQSRAGAAPATAAPANGTPAVGAATAIPDGPAPPLPDTLQAAADRQAALGTPGGLYESGRYYLTAAFEATGTNPVASAQWARRAAEEFRKSLASREDADVRIALAEALRFDPSVPPMQPIEEVQRVLATAPDHPGANYLLGDLRLMRAQFQPEWADSARVSFERVVAVAPPGSEIYARAQQALAALASAAAAPPAAPAAGGAAGTMPAN